MHFFRSWAERRLPHGQPRQTPVEFWLFCTIEIKHRDFFSPWKAEGQVTWLFPRLPFAGRRFKARKTFSCLKETRKRELVFAARLYRLFLHFDQLFLFTILFPHVLFVKLKEFQIRAKKRWQLLCIFFPVPVNGDREHFPCSICISLSLKESWKKNWQIWKHLGNT